LAVAGPQSLAIAKGSACEVISHLYVSLDQNYVDPQEFAHINRLAEDTANLIGGLMKYIAKSSIGGATYAR